MINDNYKRKIQLKKINLKEFETERENVFKLNYNYLNKNDKFVAFINNNYRYDNYNNNSLNKNDAKKSIIKHDNSNNNSRSSVNLEQKSLYESLKFENNNSNMKKSNYKKMNKYNAPSHKSLSYLKKDSISCNSKGYSYNKLLCSNCSLSITNSLRIPVKNVFPTKKNERIFKYPKDYLNNIINNTSRLSLANNIISKYTNNKYKKSIFKTTNFRKSLYMNNKNKLKI